jgi:hypothetical protein
MINPVMVESPWLTAGPPGAVLVLLGSQLTFVVRFPSMVGRIQSSARAAGLEYARNNYDIRSI